MEKSARTSFSCTIGFDWRRKWMENFCQTNSGSFSRHRVWDKPSCDGRNCGTSISDHQDWDKPPGDGLHLDTSYFPLHRGLNNSCADGRITCHFWLKTPSTLWKFLPWWKSSSFQTWSRPFAPSTLREFLGRWNPLALFNHRGWKTPFGDGWILEKKLFPNPSGLR